MGTRRDRYANTVKTKYKAALVLYNKLPSDHATGRFSEYFLPGQHTPAGLHKAICFCKKQPIRNSSNNCAGKRTAYHQHRWEKIRFLRTLGGKSGSRSSNKVKHIS